MNPMANTKQEKRKLYFILSIGIIISLFMILSAQPEETGWWIFKSITMPYQFFAGMAFVIAAIYVFALVRWFSSDRFEAKTSIIAFLVCGGISILACLFLYPLFYAVAIREIQVEGGWWLFTSTETVYEYANPLVGILDRTASHAGLIEEPAKFLAILVVPQVRQAIVDRRSGLYYATLCAFGFALIENITYFQAYQTVLFARANPAHAVFTSIWGAAYGSWVAKDIPIWQFLKYFAYGIGLHALWNFCASVDLTLFIITFGSTIWLGLGFIRKELLGSQQDSQVIDVESGGR